MKFTCMLLFAFLILPQSLVFPQVIFKSSFEEKNGSLPANWEVISRQKYSIEPNTFDNGSCIQLEHDEYSSSKIISDKINLKVGALYKLSGFIKTENAFTNPFIQYPTPLAACLTMNSFPFTLHSEAVGATNDWQKVEIVFIATTKNDNIVLNFGLNGDAKGKVWFDNIVLEEEKDFTKYIAPETIKYYDNAFRFENDGWIFVHIEGEPYKRGYQYGFLLAEEIKEFITKFGTKKNLSSPQTGWNDVRFICDAMFLRKYDEELLTEMKGIADGVNKAGVQVFGRSIDLIDVVAMNSNIDMDYSSDALHVTGNKLTGKTFLTPEDELELKDKLHKCSGLLATKSATKDSRIVFGQLFMWNGYMGPHWNVIVDLTPVKGNRLVYQTFPGGIHSGADFYINSSGIMIGETTVNQTPFNSDGTPQSNRIRLAAQYANSIDDVVKIMTKDNNGLYTNDWLIGDTKTDEIAILVLGTEKYKLWRSSENDFYDNQKDWYWSDNNNKSMEVRKEYVVNDGNAPYDLIFKPVNRDIAFWNFYEANKGSINANSAINLFNTSPVNRPHACDGKVTTSDMAENLMFFANYGKTTLREMFINENGRIPDMPGAVPKLSLGYSVISPLLFTEKINELKQKQIEVTNTQSKNMTLQEGQENFKIDKSRLWQNTVYPKSNAENWFISGTAAYRNFLNNMPEGTKGFSYSRDELAGLSNRYLYFAKKEGSLKPIDAKVVYNKYNNYQLPMVKGTILLHQLRLMLGNETFLKIMNEIHNNYKEKEITNNDIISLVNKISGKKLGDFISQWIEREGLPELLIKSRVENENGYKVIVDVEQKGDVYKLFGLVNIETEKGIEVKSFELNNKKESLVFQVKEKPVKVIFNSGYDFLIDNSNYCTFSNFTDEFENCMIVYGTVSQSETGHTLALRFQKTLADKFTEVLLPVTKDNEVTNNDLITKDLIVIGGVNENSFTKKIIEKVGVKSGKNFFTFNGKTYSSVDDGLFIAAPSPYNNKKIVYLFISNSSMQLYNMVKNFNRMPTWAIFKKDQIVEKGFIYPDNMEVLLTK